MAPLKANERCRASNKCINEVKTHTLNDDRDSISWRSVRRFQSSIKILLNYGNVVWGCLTKVLAFRDFFNELCWCPNENHEIFHNDVRN